MTRLYDEMERATRHSHVDAAALHDRARKQGLAIRRRRQTIGTVGIVASVAAIAVSTQLLGGQGTPEAQPASSASATPTPAPQPSATPAPMNPGRLIAGGLLTHLPLQEDDTYQDVEGQGIDITDQQYAGLRLVPNGEGSGWVQLNRQVAFDRKEVYDCSQWKDCTIKRNDDGSILMTFTEQGESTTKDDIRLVADYLRPDGIRIVVSASNGDDLPKNKWLKTRDDAVLTLPQLVKIATSPDFGFELPETEFAAMARRITAYKDIDKENAEASVTLTPTPSGGDGVTAVPEPSPQP